MFKRLILFALVLTWLVAAFGAYVRLSDAGLGCPDWPGCYGRFAVPATQQQFETAQKAFPGRPLEVDKAWKEMLHRYAAGTLGMLILAIFVSSWRQRPEIVRLSALLVLVVGCQALLGRWTVTELLRPVVVCAHLLGGMTTLALLAWIALAAREPGCGTTRSGALRWWGAFGLAALAVQIALGGWTSSHYAALACGDGLSCRGSWFPEMDLAAGFSLSARASATPEALTAIHWSHRLGAVAVAATVAGFAVRALREPGLRDLGWLLLMLLTGQLILGLINVGMALPLAAAVLHNAVAALLLVAMVAANWDLWKESK